MEDQILKYVAKSIHGVQESISNDLSEIRKLVQELAGQVISSGTQNLVPDMYGGPALAPHTLSHKPSRVELDRFHGVNPEAWIFQAEGYFEFYGIAETHKLSVASFYLAGDALKWFRWLDRNDQFIDWRHFTEKLIIHFRNCNRCATHSTAKIFKSDFASTLDDDHAHQVFDKSPHGNWCHSHTRLSNATMKFFTKEGHNCGIADFKVPESSIPAGSVSDIGSVAEIAATNIIDELAEVLETNVITPSKDPELADGEIEEESDVKLQFQGSISVVPECLGVIDLLKRDKYTEEELVFEEFVPIIKVVQLPAPICMNLAVSESLSNSSSHNQSLFTITESYARSHGTGRHNKIELLGAKLPIGRVPIVQMDCCHMRVYSYPPFEPEPILWVIPFGSYVDAWFDTGQDFHADFNVLISIECGESKQCERFTPLSNQPELDGECPKVARFLPCLFGQPVVSLVPKAVEHENTKSEFVDRDFPFDSGSSLFTTFLKAIQNGVCLGAIVSMNCAKFTTLISGNPCVPVLELKFRNTTKVHKDVLMGVTIFGRHYARYFVACSLRLRSTLAEVLDKGIESLDFQGNIRELLLQCCSDNVYVIQHSVFGLLVFCPRVCPVQLRHYLTEILVAAAARRTASSQQKNILAANNAWPGGGTTPCNLLKRKGNEEVNILMPVWDDRISVHVLKRTGLMTTYDEDIAACFQDVDIHYVICLRNHVDGESLNMDLKLFIMVPLPQQTVIMDYDSSNGESQSSIVLFVGGSSLWAWQYAGALHIFLAELILKEESKIGIAEIFNVNALILICPNGISNLNLEDKVLIHDGSIVVNQPNYIRAYGLEAPNENDSVKIIGLTKMLESFIWDPGPISI